MRRHQPDRLVIAPQPGALGLGQRLAVNADLAVGGYRHGRRLQHLAVDGYPALDDPALGIAARAQPGACQHLGDALWRLAIVGEAEGRLWQAVFHETTRHRAHRARRQSRMTKATASIPEAMALALDPKLR